MKTEIDADYANNSKHSSSDSNQTKFKNTVKEELHELTSEQKFIIELIELYHTLPALWDKKCVEYKDRESKDIQYNILLEKYKERYPSAVKNDIKRKMSSLRSNFRRELERPFTTNLYYFDALRFICNTGHQKETQNLLYDLDDTQVSVFLYNAYLIFCDIMYVLYILWLLPLLFRIDRILPWM